MNEVEVVPLILVNINRVKIHTKDTFIWISEYNVEELRKTDFIEMLEFYP